MAGTLELLEGLAGTGKTERLLGFYSEALSESQRASRLGTTLWLAPNRRDTEEIGRRLVARHEGVLFAPRVLTFADFANQILDRAASQVVPLSTGQQRTLLRRIIERRRSAGDFTHFGPIAGSTGFLDLVQSFIAELKRAETWPEVFREACAARGASRRDRELALVYEEYQRELLNRRWFDAEGRFWWAREKLRQGEWGAFGSLDLVVVDGFDDFNQTQYEILGLLSDRAQRMVLSLPMESPLVRGDLFAKTLFVKQELARHAELKPAASDSVNPVASEVATPAAFRQIARHLFGNPRTVPVQSDSQGVEIVAVAGQRGEVRWLAARIKRLLLDNVPASDIVVVLRDVAEYADLIGQIFPASGIPTAVDHSPALFESPVVRVVLRLLELELSDWEFERLRPFLRSPFFRPGWSEAQGGAVSRTLAALRRLQLGSDREVILETLERDMRNTADQRSQQQSAEALALLQRLDRVLSNLRISRTLTGWGGLLRELGSELGILSQSREHPGDAVQWNLAIDVLFSAGKLEQVEGSAPRSLDLAGFLREFSDLLRHQELSTHRPEAGRVRILAAADIRNLDVPFLFVAGLSEQSFPRRRSDDCLYGEAERRQLNENGLALGHHAVRTQEEMLLFYRVVTRARKELVLSYPAVSADGAPLSPSPYLIAVRELFELKANLKQTEEQLDPIPRAGRVLSAGDLRVRAMHDALEQRPALLAAAAQYPLTSRSVSRVFHAVDLNIRRFHEPGFGSADGMLENARNRNWLEQEFSRERQFSATHLEGYGDCPFRFFVSRVLRVEPLVEIEFATDHGERGLLIHSVLAQLHQELLVDGSPPTIPPEGDSLAKRFSEILLERRNALPPTDPLREVVADLELRTLAEWGDEYGRQWDEHLERCAGAFDMIPQPVLFEIPFGSRSGDAEPGTTEEQPKSPERPPLVVGAGDRVVLLTGRIDRVDVGTMAGKKVFFVVDYKSGARKSLNRTHIAQGRNLQLPLYALAVSHQGMAGEANVPAQAAFWYLKDGGFTPGLKSGARGGKRGIFEILAEADWGQIVDSLNETIPKIAEGMRRGAFPVYNADTDCTQFCPYKLVCRVNQIRPLEESLAKVWSLSTTPTDD